MQDREEVKSMKSDLVNKIHCADCIDFMKEEMPDHTVDTIICDPPYG